MKLLSLMRELFEIIGRAHAIALQPFWDRASEPIEPVAASIQTLRTPE